MTELEKMAHARKYIEKLANGINPLTGQMVPDGDVINNVKISRCLFYVSDLLRQIVENGGISQPKVKIVKQPFQLDYEVRKQFRYSESPISISEITRRINALISTEKMQKLSYKQIRDWLVELDFLVEITQISGKITRRPTRDGVRLGITMEHREGQRGPYSVIVYDLEAQKFILDNLDGVIERAYGHLVRPAGP